MAARNDNQPTDTSVFQFLYKSENSSLEELIKEK